MDKQHILMISYGSFGRDFLEELTNAIGVEYNLPVTFDVSQINLSEFYDPVRRQYDGNKLLEHLGKLPHTENSKKIGLFQVDLFIPILTFIFGQALFNGDVGIASSYRLKNELYGLPANEELLFGRFLKVVIHELGHTFGLTHCHTPTCVMRAGTYVEDIDQKNHHLCKVCMGKLESTGR